MGSGSSSARPSSSFDDFMGPLQSAASSANWTPSWRSSLPSRKGPCTEYPRSSRQNCLHFENEEWAPSSSFAEYDQSFGCHQARLRSQVVVHAPHHSNDVVSAVEVDLSSFVHAYCDYPNSLSDIFDSPDAAVVPSIIGILDLIEASVTAGRSKLSLHALPFLVKCRESIASCRDDVHQCASALRVLAMQLENSCNVPPGNGHSCVPELELLYQLFLRVREASPGSEKEAAEALLFLAKYYRSNDRFEEAATCFQRLAGIISSHVGNSHPSVAAAFNFLAESLAQASRFSEAEYACKRAIAIAVATLGAEHRDTQGYRRNLDALWVMKAHYKSESTSRMARTGTGHSTVGMDVAARPA
eukprot:jgi/Mesvir1/6986/Mv09126-RA.1